MPIPLRLLINVLSQVPSKEHDHEHAYSFGDLTSFQKRSRIKDGILPLLLTQPVKDEYSFKEYTFYLEIYNTHVNINQATVALLKKLCPTGLVRLEVGFSTPPTNLKVDAVFKYLLEMAALATVDTKIAIELQKSAYSLQYSPNANEPTDFFQQMQHLQY